MVIRTYDELCTFETFEERFEYAKLNGIVSEITFGQDRYLNQLLYHSNFWKEIKREVIIRDNGFDLGLVGYPIKGKILVHHLNPITVEMIEKRDPMVFDPNFLISVSLLTHNAIHYGNETLIKDPIERLPNDTCPWK